MNEKSNTNVREVKELANQLFVAAGTNEALASMHSEEDAMSNLRIGVKYLLFDNDALRRENYKLREMLDGLKHCREDDVDHTDTSDEKETAEPCPYCREPLRTPLAKQCFHCHMDWHNLDNIIKHEVGRNESVDEAKPPNEEEDDDKRALEALGLDD